MENLMDVANPTDSKTPSQDYIDQLEVKFKNAERALSKACEEAKNQQKSFDTSNSWFLQLEANVDNIEKTDDLAKEVELILLAFEKQTDLVGINTGCNVDAIKILLLKAKDTAECVEALKALMSDFQNKLKKITNPKLEKGVSIMEIIGMLEGEIELALQACKESITAMLNLLKCAIQINSSVCETDSGLAHALDNMKATLATEDEEKCKPYFPLKDQDGGYNNDYYQELVEKMEDAEKEKKENKNALEVVKEKKAKAQSNHDALKAALEAANAAKTC